MQCTDLFTKIYNRDPDAVSFCPYRVCPIGAHSDHQLGKITGIAIDKGVHIAYSVKHNGVVELTSLQFNKRAQWHIESIPTKKQNDWADYLRGATMALSKRHKIEVGLCGVIEGTMPIGGLSSSASVTIVFLSALAAVNGISITSNELILMVLEAENCYVGVSCGKLDPSCEVYSRKGHILYMDTLDDTYELIQTPVTMKPYKIAVFFSGIERTLAGSKFNVRVDECRSAAYALKAYAGMDYSTFIETNLREVSAEIYYQYKDRLPENFAKRAEHWYTEYDRVQRGAEAWRMGDIEEFGRLSFESGCSSIKNWETGSDELIMLHNIMHDINGVYGGRFSGAGFNGCYLALIDPNFEDSIFQIVRSKYIKAFPKLENKFSAYICGTADGVMP